MKSQKKTFILFRDREPAKLIYESTKRACKLTQRVQSRFPAHAWSIEPRFPFYATD